MHTMNQWLASTRNSWVPSPPQPPPTTTTTTTIQQMCNELRNMYTIEWIDFHRPFVILDFREEDDNTWLYTAKNNYNFVIISTDFRYWIPKQPIFFLSAKKSFVSWFSHFLILVEQKKNLLQKLIASFRKFMQNLKIDPVYHTHRCILARRRDDVAIASAWTTHKKKYSWHCSFDVSFFRLATAIRYWHADDDDSVIL